MFENVMIYDLMIWFSFKWMMVYVNKYRMNLRYLNREEIK